MVVNLAAHTSFTVDDTVSGTVSLTRAQLQALVDEDYSTNVITLSGSDILVLDVDFGNRIATQDLRYYFDSATASGTVVSSIQWYYKNYDTDVWYSLTTIAGGGYYTTTTISGIFYPQIVRLVHTISGTGITGTVREYEVNSNDDIVDFGEDGTLEVKELSDTPIGESEAFTVPVYNDGQKTATAFVYIGNTDTDADEMLEISDILNGSYISIDDGFLIDGDQEGLPWSVGSYSGLTVDNYNLILNTATEITYSTGWENMDSTLGLDAAPATIAWHPTDPWQSTIFYIIDNTLYKYNLYTGTHVSVNTTPRSIDSSSYGVNDDLVYDPVNNRLYYFLWKDSSSEWAHLVGYYCDLDTYVWSGLVVDNDFGDDGRKWTVRGTFFEYPGTTDSKDGLFEVGESYIILNITTGHAANYYQRRIRLSDHQWSSITGTGYLKLTGDNTGIPRPCGVCIQKDNLENYPQGTVAVIWAYSGSGSQNQYEYLNAYAITDQTGATQTWQSTRIYNISPRDPSIDTWFQNQCFTGAGKFFFYDEATDRLFISSSANNDLYAVYYNVGGQLLGENIYRLYRWYIGISFFDSNWDNGFMYGDGRRYDDGVFWFMSRLLNEELYMYFPTNFTKTLYQTSGTYTTPVFKNLDPTYWRVKTEIPENTSVIASTDAANSTIEIRSSDTGPTGKDTHYYLVSIRDTGTGDYYFYAYDYNGNQRWVYTTSDSYYAYFLGCTMAVNEWYPNAYNSGNTFAFIGWNYRRTNYFNRLYFRLFNYNGSNIYSRTMFDIGDYNNYYRITNAVFAKNGMIYTTYRGIGTESDRIMVLDSQVYPVNTLEFTGDQSTLYSMCVGGDDYEDLWIIKEDQNEVRRYDQTLQLVQTVENQSFGNLNGICSDGEGGFFVGETQAAYRKIWHYDESGVLVSSFDVSDYVNAIHRIKKDYFGGIWLLDTTGDQIARFTGNGIFLGKVSLLSPQGLASTPLGCWVISEVYERHYFVNLDIVVEKTNTLPYDTYISYDGDNWEGAFAQSIEYDGYIDPNNIPTDTVWGNSGSLEWNEVGKDTNFVPFKTYHQARITLRSDGSDTPILEKVALPPAIALYNISPQNYKNIYIKTNVPDGTTDALRQGKIRSWFSVEE